MRRGERPLLQLPRALLLAFALLLGIQLSTHHHARQQQASVYRPLASPFSADSYRGMSMGSPQAVACRCVPWSATLKRQNSMRRVAIS